MSALTERDLDLIYNTRVMARQNIADTVALTGRSQATISAVVTMTKAAQAEDWDLFEHTITSRKLGKSLACKWLKRRFNIIVPEPDPLAAIRNQYAPSAQQTETHARPDEETKGAKGSKDNEDAFWMKIITELAKQTALLGEILKAVKCYGTAITTNTERKQTVQIPEDVVNKIWGTLEAIDDRCIEIKDNTSANFDALNMPVVLDVLRGIKQNTRKKGL